MNVLSSYGRRIKLVRKAANATMQQAPSNSYASQQEQSHRKSPLPTPCSVQERQERTG